MREILQVSELDQAMEIFENEKDAFAAAGITAKPRSFPVYRRTIRNLKHWAKPAGAISLADRVTGARNLNVNDRRAVGP